MAALDATVSDKIVAISAYRGRQLLNSAHKYYNGHVRPLLIFSEDLVESSISQTASLLPRSRKGPISSRIGQDHPSRRRL